MPVIPPTSDAPLRRAPVAVIDWETTWVDEPKAQHPVSVAIIHCDLGVAGSEKVVMSELIKPDVPIRPEATKIHGISDSTVMNAPKVRDLASRIEELIDGRVVASYNVPFDIPILQEYVDVPFGTLCPLSWRRGLTGRLWNNKLSEACAPYGIKFNAHDATEDAMATARLMPMLLRDLKGKRGFDVKALDSIAGIWEFTKWAGLDWEERYAKYTLKKGRPKPDLSWTKILGAGQ